MNCPFSLAMLLLIHSHIFECFLIYDISHFFFFQSQAQNFFFKTSKKIKLNWKVAVVLQLSAAFEGSNANFAWQPFYPSLSLPLSLPPSFPLSFSLNVHIYICTHTQIPFPLLHVSTILESDWETHAVWYLPACLPIENIGIACRTTLFIFHYTLRSHNLLFSVVAVVVLDTCRNFNSHQVSIQPYKFPEILYTCP